MNNVSITWQGFGHSLPRAYQAGIGIYDHEAYVSYFQIEVVNCTLYVLTELDRVCLAYDESIRVYSQIKFRNNDETIHSISLRIKSANWNKSNTANVFHITFLWK